METIDIKRVQKRLLEMGKNIASILESNDIPYIITFGTLLGAVRHGGFIPWDDDFDFFLFDDTYDKAIELLRKNLPNDMFLENEKSELKYFHGWAHVKDMNSEVYCEQFPQDNLYNHHGLSVDLYKCKRIHSSKLLDYRIVEMEKYLKRKLDKGIIDLSSYNSQRDILKEAIEKEEKNNHGGFLSSISEGLAAFVCSCDIEEHEFIRPLLAVGLAQLHGVACIAQVHEIDTFDGAAVLHVQTGDDALG